MTGGIEFEPGGDYPRDDQVEGADVEGEDDSRGDGVLCRCELGDVVGDGDAEDAGVSGLREETEDVFVVEVPVGEGAGDVDATLDLSLLR